MTTLTAAFAQAAADYHDRTALIDGDGTAYGFSEVKELADRYAVAWSAKGVRPGDRVLIAMGIGADLYASLAALWSLGATAVLPEPAMGLAGIKTAIKATDPRFFCAAGPYRWIKLMVPGLWGAKLLTPGQQNTVAYPKQDVDPDSTALISFTSGTTGTPKAIPRSHAFLMAQWKAVAPLLQSEAAEIDLVTFPVFVLINLAEGRTSVLPSWKMSKLSSLDASAVVHWIKTHGCTRALLPPALCEKVVAAQDTGTLHHILTGGGPVFPDVVQRLKDITPELEVTTVYGSTEAEPIAHAHTTVQGYGLFAGHPVDAVRLRIVEGEIQVAGDHVNTGYLDPARDRETKVRDGDAIWHRTGDAGHLDDQGRLWLLGRVGDEVRTERGVQHPFAIETAARMWPGVSRVALMERDELPVLVVAGDAKQVELWRGRAAEFGINEVQHVAAIPLDKRHHSKVDRVALRKLLG
ncbi:acyl-CoA synthetase (AMP-forming)/AMP-acid ligase II [Yoonia maricola]|uniref:Acyl-CoA synthetase (AMP-forming)/AMP-acid ligase II n=1 Tax=Yoonia maricola TaxID=420999 RepID=A0A2M8WQC2_9RHOB|nr:AMP-binding protein [Yoonia maricola]PJI93135.1 acyl-CoA synthetase (AMP-forming)/AMP-acid ligase II [Yoonia maricola]